MQAIAPNQDESVRIRPASAADRSFVLATWLNGHRHGSAFASRITNEVYFPNQHDIVEAILEAPGTVVHVACLPDDLDVILGYLVAGDNAVHWAHVKREFRRFGILRRLIAAAGLPSDLNGVSFSHDSRIYRSHLEGKFPRAVFNPFLALRPRR